MPESAMRARFREPVSGASYRPSARLAAVGALVMLIGYGFRALEQIAQLPSSMWVMMALGTGGVAYTVWYILTGQTTIDADGVRQQWFTERHYSWDQIKWARHLRLPMTSRLMISTGKRPLKVIQAGTPELDAAFREIAAHYRASMMAERR